MTSALAAAFVLLSLHARPSTTREIAVSVFILLTALVFEEAMRWASRMRVRVGPELSQDMQAVWGVAAALALPRLSALVVVAVLAVYAWLRHQRPAGQPLNREVFNGANALIACFSASVVFRALGHPLDGHSSVLRAALVTVAAVLVYTVLNRLVALCALLTLSGQARAILGSREDNLVELATLCLGVLVAVAIVVQPVLALVVLPPMITLQRAAAIRDLETAATTDAKTGLLNAVAWEQVAARELARSERDGSPIGVLIIDIDHFKRVNDRFGHLAGDNVLRFVGRILAGAVREYDTVARFGGEEFVAVLPKANAEEAFAVAERLRARINDSRISQVVDAAAPTDDLELAVSIGVSTAQGGTAELHQLLLDADTALYQAKAMGRNRVVLAAGPDTESEQTQPVAS